MTHVIGFVAAIVGAFAFIPQVIKTWRTGSCEDLSLGMLAAQTTATTLWVVYGVAIGSAPVVIGNAMTLLLSLSLVVLKLRSDSRRRGLVRIE